MPEPWIIVLAAVVYIIGYVIQFVYASRNGGDTALIVFLTPFWPVTVAFVILITPCFLICDALANLARKLGAVDHPNNIPSC